jgi:FkbM family methyltransferase
MILWLAFVQPSGYDSNLTMELKKLHNSFTMVHGNSMDELPEQIMAFKHIRPSAVVLELGGNVGTNSLVINSRLTTPRNHVVVEPVADSQDKLRENRDANGAQFQVCPFAISKIPLVQKGWRSKPLPSNGLQEGWNEIPTISYSDLQTRYQMPFDTLVADCEGCLNSMLRENPDMLSQITQVILEHDFATDGDFYEFLEAMKTGGFKKVDEMRKGDQHCPSLDWSDGRVIDPTFVSVWEK